MGGLTPEDLQTDNYIAVHRNKLLAEAFYLWGDVEKYGTGFIRIRKFLADCPNIKLELIPRGDFIKTVITDLKVTPQVTPQVEKLVMVMDGIMTREELQRKLALSDREYFRTNYLIPAIKNEIIEMTIPDKPKSKNQKYRLTTKGNEYKKIGRFGS